MKELKGTATINLDYYVAQLRTDLFSHVASLRNTLRSIEDGSYFERSRTAPPSSIVAFQLPDASDPNLAAIEEIRKAFLAVVRSFTDFVDTLLGIRKFVSMPHVVARAIHGPEDLEAYIRAAVLNRAQKVGTDGHLSSPRKVAQIGTMSAFPTRAVNGYFDIRAALEHHKAVAQKDVELATQFLVILIDGEEVTVAPPINVEKGQTIGYGWRERVHAFSRGVPIDLTEAEVEGAVRTLLVFVVPELIKAMTTQRT